METTKNHHHTKKYTDFLEQDDHQFLLWRLTRDAQLETFWTNYIAVHPDEQDAFRRAIVVADSIMINHRTMPNSEKLYGRISHDIRQRQHRHARIVNLWHKVAATAAIILLLAGPVLYIAHQQGQHNGTVAFETLNVDNVHDVELIIGKQRLILPDSAQLSVRDNHIFCGQRDLGAWPVEDKVSSRLLVPVGKHTFLSLADKSQLWVNSATEVDFPLTYSSSSRDIRVKGEIFIDVTRNPTKPFTVHTNRMDVLVHGTRFNVSAYPEDEEASVVLVSGKVEAFDRSHHSMMMMPNQRISVSKGSMKRENVNVSRYVSWKDGYLSCEEIPVTDVMCKVARYYGITFDTHNTLLAQKKITGKLYLSSNVDNILASIALLTGTHYTRNNNHVIFRNK